MYILGLPVVYEVGITLNTYYTTKGYYLNSLVNVEHDTGWTPAQSIPESYSEFGMALVYPPARLRCPGNQLCGAPQRERPPQAICVDSGSLPLRRVLARRGLVVLCCRDVSRVKHATRRAAGGLGIMKSTFDLTLRQVLSACGVSLEFQVGGRCVQELRRQRAGGTLGVTGVLRDSDSDFPTCRAEVRGCAWHMRMSLKS